MDLTPTQRHALARYRSMRDRPLTALGLLDRAVPYFVAAVLTTVLFTHLGLPREMVFFLWGGVVGAILREIRFAHHAARVLPALFSVIDWARLDAKLAEPEPPDSPGPRFRLD